MAKVSVIIPTHNRAEYLRLAIASVLNQSYRGLEIVIVDDASADNTFEVVTSFDDERIKYLRHALCKGGSAARNTGIMNSSSKYVAFLDDDDEWLPDKLRKQLDLLEKASSKIGAVYTGHMVVDYNSRNVIRIWSPKKRGNIYEAMFEANWVSTTSSVLLRRECFERVGLFDENLPSFQDYDMWIRISKEFNFEYINETLVKYRIHGDKIWTNLEALDRGIELMLKKYGESPAFRKNYSNYYLGLGVGHCNKGNIEKGREAFISAIRLYPFDIRHYFNLFLSFLGADNFRRLKEIKKFKHQADIKKISI
ncbi:MAG TPA: glycosyltransferase [Thermodesulfobacteriota bacterium]|nr:glycosyltransferase [Thermodesulfobacteriota bacterium]